MALTKRRGSKRHSTRRHLAKRTGSKRRITRKGGFFPKGKDPIKGTANLLGRERQQKLKRANEKAMRELQVKSWKAWEANASMNASEERAQKSWEKAQQALEASNAMKKIEAMEKSGIVYSPKLKISQWKK